MKALWQLFRAGRIERQASDKLNYRGPSVACVGCGNNFGPGLVQPCWRCRIAADKEEDDLLHRIAALLESERQLRSEAKDAIPFRWHGGRASAFAQVLDMLTEQPTDIDPDRVEK